MTRIDDLYCAHVERVGLLYPDATHVQHWWGADKNRIQSKVVFGDDIEICVSVIEPGGTIRHVVERYQNSPRERAIMLSDV
jgi:hypothetical protein